MNELRDESAKASTSRGCLLLRTIGSIWRRHLERGNSKRAKGSGRPASLTEDMKRRLFTAVRRDRTLTSEALKHQFNLDVSKHTICRALKAQGLINTYQVKNPFLSPEVRRKRLIGAKKYEHWDVSMWRRVFWTDESPFALRFKGRQRIWRFPNEKYHPECVKGVIKHDEKINVWAGFSYNGVGAFHRVEGIMLKEQYLSIVDRVGLASALALLGEGCIWQ